MNVKYNNLATQRYYKVTISDTNKTLSIYLIFSSRTVPFTYWALQQNKCNCLCFHRPGFLSLILFKGDYFYNGLFLMILGYQSIKRRYYVNANCFHNIIYFDNHCSCIWDLLILRKTWKVSSQVSIGRFKCWRR